MSEKVNDRAQFMSGITVLLFVPILVLLILLYGLPVHAATVVEPQGSLIFDINSKNEKYNYTSFNKLYITDTAEYNIAVVNRNEDLDYKTSDYLIYYIDSLPSADVYVYCGTIQHNENDKVCVTSSGRYPTSNFKSVTLSNNTVVYYMCGGAGNSSYTYNINVPIFDGQGDYGNSISSIESVKSFLEHLLVIGDIKPSNTSPDTSDEAYSFTGFTMNGKTASWTGTTQRSHLLDQDVEEYTTFTYGFASSEDQTVSSFIEYDGEYATADKKLKLPWDEMEAKKKDGEFIRQVNIVPCYRVPGAFYRGVGAKVYFHKDGSIDKIELPSSSGTFSSDMERPIIVLNEGSNGKNPLEGDYSYFRFNNAQDDYYIEMKGRWYSTNDFDLYKENLVWKYKYQTILKNDLSTWVSVSDNVNSVGAFKFDVLGKTSWENLLSLYPVDDRNYEGGSFALMNKITGYSDALDTLKMLLKQPYSLYNGYEVYVRYYRYADDGGIQYSKWTHFYNNLANAGGSSGSRLDDLDNMYSENQSEKGLTDDQLSDLENSGNSRNDTDAVPKNNYDYSSLENATMNFFDMLKNYGSLLGEFPSMVASVFGFLPSWLIAFIGIAIGAVIVCRFIGR